MTIRQLATTAGGVSLRTIRYYEELGLIHSSGSSKGCRRIYGEDALLTMRKVRLLQETGMKLAEIGDLLMTLAARTTVGKDKTLAHIEALERIYRSLVTRRDAIHQLISGMEHVLKSKEKCTSCDAADCDKCERLVKWSRFGLIR